MAALIGRKIAFAVSATWLTQAIRIALNLVGLPIMFRFLGQEELGIWLILGQSGILAATLLDGGLLPTLTRRIAFAAGKSRNGPDQPLDEESRREIANLLTSGAIVYRWLALAVFVISVVGGGLYFSQLPLHHVSTTTIWIALPLMSLGQATITWSTLTEALTIGLGYVAANSIIGTGVIIATLATQILGVVAGGGILWLSGIAVISGIAARLALWCYVRRRQPQLLSTPGRWDPAPFRSITGLAVRSWLTAVGATALFASDRYIIALYINPSVVPVYYAAYTLLHNLALLALALGQTSSPFISQLWTSGRLETVQAIVLRSQRVSLILMGCGTAAILAVGGDVIALWIGADHFVGYPVLVTLSGMFLVCTQQNGLLTLTRATENEVYASAFLMAGGLNIVLAWIFVQHMALVGVALATLISQLLTTNWMVLVAGLRRLKLPMGLYFRVCIVPSLVVFLVALVATLVVVRDRALLPSAIDRSVVAIAIAGCVCLVSLWLFGLTAEERSRVSQRGRLALTRQK